MLPLYLLLISHLYLLRFTLAFKIQCKENIGPFAPYDDCIAVLNQMRTAVNPPTIPHRDWPPLWGQILETDPQAGTIGLPRGYKLTHIQPGGDPNRCEIYINNIPNKENMVDQFGYRTIVEAVKSMMQECYPRRKGGVVDPTGSNVVFLATRYLAWSATNGTNVGESGGATNYTVVDLGDGGKGDGGNEGQVQAPPAGNVNVS